MSKLWKISQNVNNDYDTFDSAVVTANSAEEARLIHPASLRWDATTTWSSERKAWIRYDGDEYGDGTWAAPDSVKVEYIGIAVEGSPKVVCASFNAG